MNTEQSNSTAPPLPHRALIVLVLSLLAAWLAAGSLGWLAPGLQRSLTWLAFASIVIAAVPVRGLNRRDALVLSGAALFAVLLTASTVAVINICAVAILLAGVTQVRAAAQAQVSAPAALAVVALAVFRLLCDSSAAVWTFAGSVGYAEGLVTGWLTGRPLLIGASFGGIDFLVLMAALTAAWLHGTPRPRFVRAAWAVLFILLAQSIYLVALSYSDDLAALLPPLATAKDDDISHLGIWTWGNALRTLLPWYLPLVAALLHSIVAAGMFRLTARPGIPRDLPSEAGETSTAEGKRRNRSLQNLGTPSDGSFSIGTWRQFAPAGLLIVATAAITLSPVTPDLKERRIVAYDDGTIDWGVADPGTVPPGRQASYGLLPILIESLGGKFSVSNDLADAVLNAADVLVVLPTKTPIPDDIKQKISRYVSGGGRMIVAGEPETNLGVHENVLNPLLESTAMSFRDDTANSLTERWEDNLQSAPHSATASSSPGRSLFSFDRTASIRVSWPAGPLVVGRWGWDEVGTDPERPGALSYIPGNHLGDLVLSAQQNIGNGSVVVLGSSEALSNDGIPFSYTFTGPLLSALAANHSTPLAWWRQLTALAAGITAIVLLFRQFESLRSGESYAPSVAAAAAALSLTILACNLLNNTAAELLPSGTNAARKPVIYVDGSHLEGIGKDPWGENGTGRFMHILASNGYLPLVAPDLSAERLSQAAMLISIAPGKAFTSGEIATVDGFVRQGGFFLSMVGSPEAEPSRPILEKFKLQLPPIPVPASARDRETTPNGMFSYPNERQPAVNFYASWPASSGGGGELWPKDDPIRFPVIAGNRFDKGQAFVIGDTCFALKKNFEPSSPNPNFWRSQLERWLGRESAGPQPSNPPPSNPLPLEPNTSGILNLPKTMTDKGATP